MARSSKSIKQIIQTSEELFQKLEGDYWAHIEGRKPTEGLLEHSTLVADYLQKIIEAHNLEPIIDGIIENLCNSTQFDSPEKAFHLVKETFINSIFYHDLGKVNPNFQIKKMKNPSFKFRISKIEHYHSFPGAYIFCVFYFDLIFSNPTFSVQDKNFLAYIVFSLSNSIIRHHSSFVYFYDNFDKKEILEECSELLAIYQIDVGNDLRHSIFSFVDEFRNRFNENTKDDANLNLFLLIKLSYSLLTTSDFYATNEFMEDFKISNFGLINKTLRNAVKKKFWSVKDYNIEVSNNLNKLLSFSFTNLLEKSPKNLNTLRQKLTAEVVSTIRNNSENYWYYLEAPTGAGKTNLSLACITELLEKDQSLKKVFYVFPFLTLITQTFEGIKETLGLKNDELIQIHSKSGLHRKEVKMEEDANYGGDRPIYLDHLFVNYPFAVTSHVKFFEIIKGNDKENNYLFHRLCNSIVVIDELQSYDPKHWDKIIYFIEHYAPMLNIRFIIMSATLPQIDEMSLTAKGKFISLIPNKEKYFKNPNFIHRVLFDFSLIDELKEFKVNKDRYFEKLAGKIRKEATLYASKNGGNVRVLVEFITKNSASKFFNTISRNNLFEDFKTYIISGDILEPRRKEVIKQIKEGNDDKLLLISTQVIEAGVDIDMDLGFKNRAILDSDEQLAGRINRNAEKEGCKVFLFELDNIKTVYGKDQRYKLQQLNEYFERNWKKILVEKKFHELYQKVFENRAKKDWTDSDKFPSYQRHFLNLNFHSIQKDFCLIDGNQGESIFIPLSIKIPENFEDIKLIQMFNLCDKNGDISGEKVFNVFLTLLKGESNHFLDKKIELKKIGGLFSLFTINIYPKMIKDLGIYFDPEKEGLGFKYLSNFEKIYSYDFGFKIENIENDIFI